MFENYCMTTFAGNDEDLGTTYTCSTCEQRWAVAPWDADTLPCPGLAGGVYSVG